MRWAAGLQYHGGAYAGWQFQSGAPSVQSAVEQALGAVAAHPVQVVAAGRTDAGVHAYEQVVHFDSPAPRSPYAWLLGANSGLPLDISLRWVQPVRDDFHARFAAQRRRYRYVIHNSRARSALMAGRAWWVTWPLDADAMHAAAQELLGEHDFSAFRDSQCQSRTAVREIQAVCVRRQDEFVVLDICANAFLHHMVRNIVGTLLAVGQGRQRAPWVGEVLRGRDRTRAGMTAEAQGLYFVGPEYPAEFALPAPAQPWFPPL